MLLKNKVAIITGSTKGIGEAAAIEMAKEGAKVLITGRDRKGGESVVDSILRFGGNAVFEEGDLLDASAPSRLVEAAVRQWGRQSGFFPHTGGDAFPATKQRQRH